MFTDFSAYHSVDSSELKPGDWLGVIGCGGLGQLATQCGEAVGYHIVSIDIDYENLAQTKAQGAGAVFNPRTNKNYVEELLKLTGGGVKAAAVYSNTDGTPHMLVRLILSSSGVYLWLLDSHIIA